MIDPVRKEPYLARNLEVASREAWSSLTALKHARLSANGGKTWGPDILLRGSAAAWEIGYFVLSRQPGEAAVH